MLVSCLPVGTLRTVYKNASPFTVSVCVWLKHDACHVEVRQENVISHTHTQVNTNAKWHTHKYTHKADNEPTIMRHCSPFAPALSGVGDFPSWWEAANTLLCRGEGKRYAISCTTPHAVRIIHLEYICIPRSHLDIRASDRLSARKKKNNCNICFL